MLQNFLEFLKTAVPCMEESEPERYILNHLDHIKVTGAWRGGGVGPGVPRGTPPPAKHNTAENLCSSDSGILFQELCALGQSCLLDINPNKTTFSLKQNIVERMRAWN